MAQSHTWNFYLTAGRTWGGPRISGAAIIAYSTPTGSTSLQTITTNANGYASFTLTGSTINPKSYFWRVNIGNIFGNYYSGKNVIGSGTTDGYFGIPSSNYNTTGVALMSSTFRPTMTNERGTITVYLFAVGSNVTIPSSKFLTHFDVLSLAAPWTTYLTSGTTRMTLNQCVTDSETMGYVINNAFYNDRIGAGSDLTSMQWIQPYTSFISGTSVSPSVSTTSLFFTYEETMSKDVTVTVPSDFNISVSITGDSSSYFSAYMTQVNSTTIKVSVRPEYTNPSSSQRIATLVISLNKVDSYAWFGGTKQDARVVLTQGAYYPSSGGGSQT